MKLLLACYFFDWLLIRSFDRNCSQHGIKSVSRHILVVLNLSQQGVDLKGVLILFFIVFVLLCLLFETLIQVKPNEAYTNEEIFDGEKKLYKEKSHLIFERL